jgi:hypothetical protein
MLDSWTTNVSRFVAYKDLGLTVRLVKDWQFDLFDYFLTFPKENPN